MENKCSNRYILKVMPENTFELGELCSISREAPLARLKLLLTLSPLKSLKVFWFSTIGLPCRNKVPAAQPPKHALSSNVEAR